MKVKIGPYRTHRWYHNFLYKFGIKNEQRVSVRIDKYDTWNMNTTLSHIVVPMLEQYKERHQGSPFVDLEDVPMQLRTEDHFFDRWDWVLDEMLFAHRSALEDGEEQFCSGEHDIIWLEQPDSDNREMVIGPKDTFKVDKEGLAAFHKRVKNGFTLFGKYYENLWD